MPDYPFRPVPPAAIIVRRPIHPMLIPFPIACFVGTLLTDLAYWGTAEMMWADFSAWLVSAGLILGILAAIAGIFDFVSRRAARAPGLAWPHALGTIVVLALAVLNTMVHSRDAWTSVVPLGLILSAATVLIMLVTGWLGWTPAQRTTVAEAVE